MKLLIVDDSPALRSGLARVVHKAAPGNHEIFEAANGREALERLAHGSVDLILCDWSMPEMTGMELLEELRERRDWTPFCMVSGRVDPKLRETATRAGALDLLTKPLDVGELVALIDRLAGDR